MVSTKLIALYQGVVFGLLAGGIVLLAFWGALAALGVTKAITIPAIIGSVVGLLTFISGVMGGFLPDTTA